MNRLIKIFSLVLVVGVIGLFTPAKSEAQAVNFQVFYNDLSPHGTWFESPDYGYVWRPRLSNFTPYYTNGYWAFTDAGWTWVSDYSWGWAPFHYGRWYNDPFYGYVWVPGYEWGPGWVTWRRSPDYYGWAPIGPGIGLNVAYGNGYQLPYSQWNFVPCNRFGRSDLHNYYIDRSRNTTIINNTTVINTRKLDRVRNTTYTPGPDRAEVQTKIGTPVTQLAIVDESQPTQKVTKNSVRLYRPTVKQETAGVKPVPERVTPMKTLNEKISNDRKGTVETSATAPVDATPSTPVKQPVIADDERATPRTKRQVRELQADESHLPTRQPPLQPADQRVNGAETREATRTAPAPADQPGRQPAAPAPATPRTTPPVRSDDRPQRRERSFSSPSPMPERTIARPIEPRPMPQRQVAPQRQPTQMQQPARQMPQPRSIPNRREIRNLQ